MVHMFHLLLMLLVLLVLVLVQVLVVINGSLAGAWACSGAAPSTCSISPVEPMLTPLHHSLGAGWHH